MEKSDRKIGKLFLVFAGLCVIALPLVVLSGLSYEPKEITAAVVETPSQDFDQSGIAIFTTYEQIVPGYLLIGCEDGAPALIKFLALCFHHRCLYLLRLIGEARKHD